MGKDINILVPPGIGDSVWAMIKIQSLAKKLTHPEEPVINVRLSCNDPDHMIESRSLEFISRFSFVNSAEMFPCPITHNNYATPEGYYNYILDGPRDHEKVNYVMMPNAPLERGIRLENWLPEYEANWDVMDEWAFKPDELAFAKSLESEHGEYVIFYMHSIYGNTTWGHNRNALWKPEEWVELSRKIREMHDVKIVAVGASWDNDYYDECIQPLLKEEEEHWVNLIDQTTIGQALAVGKSARYIISFQGGISMVPNYMGTPAAIFWRPQGDSIDPHVYVSFNELMAMAWVRPDNLENGKFLPLYYGRSTPQSIVDGVQQLDW
jgi:hypothetical protein